MTRKYFQLTLEQRYQIEALKDAGNNQTDISIIVGVTKSIANELGVKTYFTRPYASQDKGSIIRHRAGALRLMRARSF